MSNFGLSAEMIHLGHLAMGAFFAYVGYYKKMNKNISMALLVLGAAAAAYHGHSLLVNKGFLGGREGYYEDDEESSNVNKTSAEQKVDEINKDSGMPAY